MANLKKPGRLEDFELVYIIGVDRLSIPDVIPGESPQFEGPGRMNVRRAEGRVWINNPRIPTKVFQLFEKTRKDVVSYDHFAYQRVRQPESSNGDVLIRVYNDLKDIVSQFISIEHIDDTLRMLKSYVGRPIRPTDLMKLPGFMPSQKDPEVYLMLSEREPNKEGVMQSHVVLTARALGNTLQQGLANIRYCDYTGRA